MATVTGFEGLKHPRRADTRQFAELFSPLFAASSDEARRQAAAALSRCDHVPATVALQIGSAPIAIAALFLSRAVTIDNATLLQIIRTQSPAHATAIARRDNLSVHVVDALVERRQTAAALPATPLTADPSPALQSEGLMPPLDPQVAASEKPVAHEPAAPFQEPATEAMLVQTPAQQDRQHREEKLRGELRALARLPVAAPRLLAAASAVHTALMVRFARSGEVNLLTSSLAAALGSSIDLSERIVLDISGLQLATALSALDIAADDSLAILCALYPDLAQRFGAATRAAALIASLPMEASRPRVESWLRTEHDQATRQVTPTSLAPNRDDRGIAAHPQKKARALVENETRRARR